MVVQQHILNWLYSVLTSEYHDVNRTYNDVAQALAQYPSLSPRTDVHTFPNGASALLVHLSGTIPVLFRGTTYRFPISLWVPHAYPREAPLIYVTPTENMVVRPGQHVDPQGQVYHPYLVGWSGFWDKSSILDFLAILTDIFAKEPPVISRQAARPPPPPQQNASTPPPVPPLPPDMTPRQNLHGPARPVAQERPPALPPKGGDQAIHQPSPPPAATRSDGLPPIPPHPPGLGLPPGGQYGQAAPASPMPSNRMSRYDSAPPLPPLDARARPDGERAAQGIPPQDMARTQYQPPPSQAHHQYRPSPPQQPNFPLADPGRSAAFTPPQSYAQGPPAWQPQPPPAQALPKQRAPPPPDIMDEPLMLAIPETTDLVAPPIPPNPEKDALLHQLAQTLHSMRQRSRAQNESSLHGLQAQRTAMLNALAMMQSEAAALTQISALLASNTAILHGAMRTADGVIEKSARQEAPAVDELLVAPTVVGNQLYEVVAEERALADAVFMLGRAVERGRISPAVFARMTRSLSREWYLKKALVRKIGKGMGLTA